MCDYSLLIFFSYCIVLAVVAQSDECIVGGCLPRDVQACDVGKTSHRDGIAEVSLLQRSFPSARRIEDRVTIQDTEYGFPLTEDTVVGSQFLHWDGNRPYRPQARRPRFFPRNAYFENVMDMGRFVAAGHKHPIQHMTLPVIVTLSVVGCIILGLLIYVLVGGLGASARPKVSAQCQKLESSDQERVGKRFVCCGVGRSGQDGSESSLKDPAMDDIDVDTIVVDVATMRPIEIDEDTFGMTLCSMTRDFYFIFLHGCSLARCVRLIKSFLLLALTIVLQVLLLGFSQFVCARQVHEIREAYDLFEVAIYGKEHTTLTENGKHRGIPAYQPPFDEAMKRLNGLSEDDQDSICRIPLSQPTFFGLILLIWTLTCLTELRKAFELQFHIWMLETVPSMSMAMRRGEEEANEEGDIIRGMTRYMKALTTIIMFIPRVGITIYLLWIGCRWLLATTDFADLIMNAVALEFVLLIKEALYVALVPSRSRHDVKNTFFEPYPKTIAPAWFNFVNTLLILALACVWVFLYMHHFQMVLPDYRWDVHDVCAEYIKERYST